MRNPSSDAVLAPSGINFRKPPAFTEKSAVRRSTDNHFGRVSKGPPDQTSSSDLPARTFPSITISGTYPDAL